MNLRTKSDAELDFIVQDCREAAQAHPAGHRAIEYLQTANAAESEFQQRAAIRRSRAELRAWTHDPLDGAWRYLALSPRSTYNVRRRIRERNNDEYDRNCYRDACWQVACYRLYDLI